MSQQNPTFLLIILKTKIVSKNFINSRKKKTFENLKPTKTKLKKKKTEKNYIKKVLFSFDIIIFVVICVQGGVVLIYKAYCSYLEINQLVCILAEIQIQILCEIQIPTSKNN